MKCRAVHFQCTFCALCGVGCAVCRTWVNATMAAFSEIHISLRLRLSHFVAGQAIDASPIIAQRCKWCSIDGGGNGQSKAIWRRANGRVSEKKNDLFVQAFVRRRGAIVFHIKIEKSTDLPSLALSLRMPSLCRSTHLHWIYLLHFLLSLCMSRLKRRFTFQLSFIHLTNQAFLLCVLIIIASVRAT